MNFYTASKSRSQGREYYSIMFRHPVRKDSTGRSGLRIRRGLNTNNSDEADILISQMNKLLSSPNLWNLNSKHIAEKLYDPIIISAFYDPLASLELNIEKCKCERCSNTEGNRLTIDWVRQRAIIECAKCDFKREYRNDD